MAGPATTQGCFADWKLFDGDSKLDPTLCFFNAGAVTHSKGREVGVWTMCVRQRDIESLDPAGAAGRAIAARNASVLLAGYVPPAASLSGLDSEGRASVISYESAADLGGVKPRSAIYYQLDCAKQTVRIVAIGAEAANAAGFRGTPDGADPAAPRGRGESLLELLCGLKADPPPAATSHGHRPAVVVHPTARATRMHMAALGSRPHAALHRPPASRSPTPAQVDAALRPRLG